MAEKLEWLFKLGDELSGSSRKMAAALGQVDAELKKVDQGLKKLERADRVKKLEKVTDPLKRQRLELQIQRDKLMASREATRAAADSTGKLGSMFSSGAFKAGLWGAAISLTIGKALQLGTAVLRAAESLAEMALNFGHAGLEAASFRRQMRLGFEISAGGKAGGNRELHDALFYSEQLSTPGAAMQKRFLQLLQGGFSGEEVPVLIQAIGDMAAAGQADKADNIVLAIRQIRAKGRLQAEELVSQLADAGLNIGTVYEKIGKLIGTDSKGAMKAITRGEVGANLGIYAIVDTIRETFSKDGVIGATAKEMSGDSMALLGMLKDRPRRLLEELEGNKGISALEGFLANLVKATDPDGPTGRRIVAKINDLFSRVLGSLFGDLAGESGMEKVESGIDAAIGAVDRLIAAGRVLTGFFQGFGQGLGLGGFAEDMGALLSGPLDEGKITVATENFRKLGEEFGKTGSNVLKLVEGLAILTDKLAGLAQYGTALELIMKPLGGSLIGTVTGGTSGKLGVVGDVLNLFNSPDPQKVTAPQTSAVRSLARPVHVDVGGLHLVVPEGTDGASVLNHLRAALPGVLADALEQAALEQGAM